MGVWKTITILGFLITAFMAVRPVLANDKNSQNMARSFNVPIDEVYAAVVQVASAGYNLKSAVKEASTVNFFTGGRFAFFVTAICHDNGKDHSVVTLSIAKSEGNPQIVGLEREKEKLAGRFWSELESTLSINQTLDTKKPSQTATTVPANGEQFADVALKSTPDGADIMVDGKFSGNTPSTLHLSVGEHSLAITSKGFQKWERTITLNAGGAVTVNATLEPETPKPR